MVTVYLKPSSRCRVSPCYGNVTWPDWRPVNGAWACRRKTRPDCVGRCSARWGKRAPRWSRSSSRGGRGGRGYRPPVYPQVSRIISLHPWPRYPLQWFSNGIRLRVCSTRLGRNPQLAGIKHLNRLEQVLARQEWDDPNIPEGLMLDEENHVIEGTQSNLFVLKGRRLITPDLSSCGVAGVVRDLVLEVAAELKLTTQVARVTLGELQRAEVLFITNSLLGVCPVAALENRRYDVRKIPDTLVQRVRHLALGSVGMT